MRFTKSRDGALRANIVLPLRVGRDDLINGAVYALVLQDGLPKSREGARKAYLDHVQSNGIYHSWDEVEDEDMDAAVERIDKLFPELVPNGQGSETN